MSESSWGIGPEYRTPDSGLLPMAINDRKPTMKIRFIARAAKLTDLDAAAQKIASDAFGVFGRVTYSIEIGDARPSETLDMSSGEIAVQTWEADVIAELVR